MGALTLKDFDGDEHKLRVAQKFIEIVPQYIPALTKTDVTRIFNLGSAARLYFEAFYAAVVKVEAERLANVYIDMHTRGQKKLKVTKRQPKFTWTKGK